MKRYGKNHNTGPKTLTARGNEENNDLGITKALTEDVDFVGCIEISRSKTSMSISRISQERK